jgi:ABC-type Zn uptake system ZnuABC Zn-binding protein ZnuA
LSIVTGLIAVLVAAVGCAPEAAGEGERPRVVATTTQVGSVAAELGGDAIELTVLLSPGVEAHDFELTPEQAAALERADLVLVSGAGLEDWLTDTIDATGGDDVVRDLSEGVALRTAGEDEPAHEHEEEEHEEEGDHADEVDPHYWLSGPNAIAMVENARGALIDLGVDAEGIEARAADLVERLESADAEVRRLMDELPAERRTVVTDHDALGYFLDEYGLEFGGSIFSGLDVSSEPSARDIEELVAEIRASGVTAVFTESAVNPQLARAVAEEAGVRLVDEPIYTDSLGPDGSGAETLDGMLLHNARVIHDGLLGD